MKRSDARLLGTVADAAPSAWFFVSPFIPKRKVTMHIENLTDRTREWSKLTRLEFNRKLEDWYNENETGCAISPLVPITKI